MTTKEQASEHLTKDNEARQKHFDAANKRMEATRPTPTQNENDLAALGVATETHEDDGSGGELKVDFTRRVMEPGSNPGPGSRYRTRRYGGESGGETPAA